ncbi:ABC transporter ATP-binding protein [Paenibacillus sp. N4]|uniref:ATP-binding cassette domain-containing protein n=1 Tax=Paenibacillus vietnamensis TaxID=2590547 RepID=UPI001CD140B3|nr:ABC transporter ATP-binding protein [Paenibacillus vietnamensis]MCA0753632.1 ABC transporter ATP-binding protein [Paenibacillus vietnamensis]
MTLLEVKDLSISFLHYAKGSRRDKTNVVDGLDLEVHEGEIVAVVGASGSGKSLLAHAVMGILPKNVLVSGDVSYKGERLDAARLKRYRGTEIALVPQSVAFLDPLMKVGEQLHAPADGREQAAERRTLFQKLKLSRQTEKLFPFQLSGGMARKVLFSTAAVARTRLIIADEPTPGMHESDVREALARFKSLAEKGCGVLLITHDIEAALRIADRIAVFYAGTAVEIARAEDFSGSGEQLRHPYTKALWRALPQNGFEPLKGAGQASGPAVELGCPFGSCCGSATGRCAEGKPEPRELRGGWVRCVHAS